MKNCIVCGKQIEESQFTNKILCSIECFHKDFWNDKVLAFESLKEDRIIGDRRIVIIDGEHYTVLPDAPKEFKGFKGHGGRKMKIQLLATNEIIEASNVWFQGVIPENLRSRLFNTAKFVTNEI